MSIPFQMEIDQDRYIRANLFPAKTASHSILIICHGYKGFKDWGMFPYVAEQLSSFVDVITFNFSFNGIGENVLDFTELDKFAKNTYSHEQEDLDVLIQVIRRGELPLQVQVAEKPIFLLGHSRGAAGALIYCFDHPELIRGVVSWNGITNVDIFTEEEKADMRNLGRAYVMNGRTHQNMPLDREILEDMDENKDRFDIITRVKLNEVPIVIIQGSEDFGRLRKGSAALVEADPTIPWIQIPGGNHTFGAVHPFQGTTEALESAISHTQQILKDWNGI